MNVTEAEEPISQQRAWQFARVELPVTYTGHKTLCALIGFSRLEVDKESLKILFR